MYARRDRPSRIWQFQLNQEKPTCRIDLRVLGDHDAFARTARRFLRRDRTVMPMDMRGYAFAGK